MVESNVGKAPKHEMSKSSELLAAPPISANNLLGKIVEEPNELPLAKSNISFYKLSINNLTEYIGVAKLALGGLAFNHLLLSLAPYKEFDLDTRDLLNDWKAIDSQPERKHEHEKIGEPWSIFDRDRLFFRQIIDEDFHIGSWRNKSQTKLVPVIRWKTDSEDKISLRGLVFDPLDPKDERFVTILKRHIPRYELGMDIRFLNPTVGYFAVCHFHPEIRGDWKTKDSYSSDCKSIQDIGATQVGPYAIKLQNTIRDGPFYSRAEQYIDSTAVPVPPVF